VSEARRANESRLRQENRELRGRVEVLAAEVRRLQTFEPPGAFVLTSCMSHKTQGYQVGCRRCENVTAMCAEPRASTQRETERS